MIRRWVFAGADALLAVFDRLVGEIGPPSAVYARPGLGVYDGCDLLRMRASDVGIEVISTPFDLDNLSAAAGAGCEAIVLAGYPRRVPVRQDGPMIVNLHPTLLPAGRGPWPFPRLILDGVAESGVTLHLATERLDEGPILAQERFVVTPDETLDGLIAKSQLAAAGLASKFARSPERLLAEARPQSSGSWWPLAGANERVVDWRDDARSIERRIRAFGKEGCLADVGARRLLIRDARALSADMATALPGSVVCRTRFEWVIATGDGLILVRFWSDVSMNGALSKC